jgi:hypothetical protein
MKDIYCFIYTNSNGKDTVSYLLLKDDFLDYILRYDWSYEMYDSIQEIFNGNGIEFEDYIFVNYHGDILIDSDELCGEIHKFCDGFCDEEEIDSLVERIGLISE